MIRITIVLFFFIASSSVFSQNVNPLFQSEETLKITIKLPLKTVIKDIDKRVPQKAELSYKLSDGTIEKHVVKIKVRGKSRSNPMNCSFPPLELNFKKKETKNTLFTGQDKLKLVTHCGISNSFKEYVLKEYLTYKLYQIISPYSFKVRLCEITYVDITNIKEPITKFGIIIESIGDVAKRNDMKVFKDSLRYQESIDKNNLDRVTMFQFMIGNLDWSIPKRHNMKIIKKEGKSLPIAVPYDFDFSGLVNTSYSEPPAGFNISNVRTRIFRGLCRQHNYEPTVSYYQKIKPKIYNLVNNFTLLKSNDHEDLVEYIDSFYTILDDPKKFHKKVIKGCRAKHKHEYQVDK